MLKKIQEKMYQIIYGKDCTMKERVLRTIILVGGLATMLGVIEILSTATGHKVSLPILLTLLLAMGGSLFVSFKYHKYNFGAVLIGLFIIMMVFPPLFYIRGGVGSGISVWLALGVFYMIIMFSGKKLAFFWGMTVVFYAITYYLGYKYPILLTPLKSRALEYIDSYVAVIIVGSCAGMIMKMQLRVFDEEHKLYLKQTEALEESKDAQNAFFANMSHEIRTPINAIMGLNEMILRNGEINDEVREYARDIQVASQMLLNQVNDILDLSQMEMEKMVLVPTQYDTAAMLGDLTEMARVQAEKKNLDLNIEVDSTLPSVLQGDEKRLKQVILNILDNAVKYTKEGSILLVARGEKISKDEIILELKVADTGIGIRKEDLEYIYDSFNRVDEKKNRKIAGSGLGLAITKQLVNLMGGEISVDSIYTKGTTFTVIVKQTIIDDTPVGEAGVWKRVEEKSQKGYEPLFEAPEARILIVDDNNMNIMVATKLLEGTKVQIDTASSGQMCLDMTLRKFYHIILLDSMMPDMDGTEVMRAIHNQENGMCRESAVIAFTGNATPGARKRYLDEGFDGYVEKPIQGRVLEEEFFRFLPTEIVEIEDKKSEEVGYIGQMQRITQRKRKKIYVTADCACDIPQDLLKKYDIKLMYLYIKTPHGRFADTREIDSSSLRQYITSDETTAYADSVTVEEYEDFFAEVLTQAENVIHITLGSKAGKSHAMAVLAAKGFDHVQVIDSGQVSCGEGLVALAAAKMAMEGKSVAEICTEVVKIKKNVYNMMIVPKATIFRANGRTSATIANICDILQLHPIIEMRQGNAIVGSVLGGSLDNAWKKGIAKHLRHKKKISKQVVFITHVGCSTKQLAFIVNEISKHVEFEKVIIEKASFSVACNSGLESIGIAYYVL